MILRNVGQYTQTIHSLYILMEYIELLESSTLGSVSPPDIGNTITEETDDTTPLSKAEIAQKLFENRCLSVLEGNRMKAGYFCDLNEIRAAIDQLKREVGNSIADRVMSDFFANNNHLFS